MNLVAALSLLLVLVPGATPGPGSEVRALSAYFGAVILPPGINRQACPGATAAAGWGGMPFVLNRQVDAGDGYNGVPWALDPNDFRVTVGGRIVTPVCATLQPAIGRAEQNTILLAGDFGTGADDMPSRIEVVGDVKTKDGLSLAGLVVDSVFPPNAGSNLLLAKIFEPDALSTSGPGQTTLCPRQGTVKIVQLTFSGGVRGPNGGNLTDDATAMAGIWAMGVDAQGQRVALNPFALRDADNDNFLDACFGQAVSRLKLIRVSVNSHLFYSPMNAPNVAVGVDIEEP